MADIILQNLESLPLTTKFTYKDMGDGTYAPVTASVAIASFINALNYTHVEKIITTVSQVVVPANPNRKYLLFINDSDTTIYLNLAGAAAANSGIRINANGGSYEMTPDIITTEEVTAIHGGTGDKLLLVTEGI